MKNKQNTVWLLAALAAPLAHFSGSGWLTAVLAAFIVLPLSLLPKDWSDMHKPLAIIQIGWLGAVAGSLLTASSAYWPSDNHWAVPVTILALAAWTGTAAAPRIGAVIALCMALLSIPTVLSAAAHIEFAWLAPGLGEWPWGLTLALLLPNLPAGEGSGRKGILYGGILAAGLSALVQGTISATVAGEVNDPFYQTARALGYLEPVVASAITLGWYAMIAYLLQSAKIIAKESGMDSMWASVLATGTATIFVLAKRQLHTPFWTVLSAFFWVLNPFLRKIKKVEKT